MVYGNMEILVHINLPVNLKHRKLININGIGKYGNPSPHKPASQHITFKVYKY